MFEIKFVERGQVRILAKFLAKCNQQSEHHIGYCGKEETEIEETLLNEFSDLQVEDCFLIATSVSEIIAAIGLDVDKEDNSAEVWGPFVLTSNHSDILYILWERLLELHKLDKYLFFVNQENSLALDFVNKIGALQKGKHYQLSLPARELERIDTKNIIPFHSRYFDDFQAIHEYAFPDTYFSAEEIKNRLNKDQKLFVYIKEEKVLGYVYVEANENYNEGTIEYIAVHPEYRKCGFGRKLITHGLQFLFSYEGINQVFLTVNQEEQGALRLYQSVGFQIDSSLLFMEWKS